MHVLLTGATGFLGHRAAAALRAAGHELTLAARSASGDDAVAVDLGQPGAISALLLARAPDAVLNLAAVPDIAPAREYPECARALNVELPAELARACAPGTRLVHVSTDQVFDGSRGGWREDDAAHPLHLYGESKLAGERAVQLACPAAAIVRPGLITGAAPAGRRSASSGLRAGLERAAAGGERPGMFTDEVRSPVAAADLCDALVALLKRPDLAGVFHAGGPEVLTRRELAEREASAWGFAPELLGATTRAAVGLAEERPADLSLDSERLRIAIGWRPGNPAASRDVPD